MLVASLRVPAGSRGAAARRTPRLGQGRDEYDMSRRADLSTTGGPTRPRHASSQPEPRPPLGGLTHSAPRLDPATPGAFGLPTPAPIFESAAMRADHPRAQCVPMAHRVTYGRASSNSKTSPRVITRSRAGTAAARQLSIVDCAPRHMSVVLGGPPAPALGNASRGTSTG
jgi:hypothetical protein